MHLITCEEALEFISAALDGPLSAVEQEALDLHLASCPECRTLQDEFSTLHNAMADWDDVLPPLGLVEQVMAEVHASKVTPLPKIKKSWRAWAGVAAVCAIALLGAGPLRLWLTPNSTMDGQTAAGAPMSVQAEPFDAMPASLPQDSTSPELTQKMTGGENGAKVAPVPSLLPGGDGATCIPSSQYALASQDKNTSAPPQSAPENVMGENPIESSRSGDQGTAAPTPQPTAPPCESPQTQTTGLMTAPRTAAVSIYCGVLSLPYDSAPDLTAYKYSQSGNKRFFIVPAEDFATLLASCKDLEGAELNPDGTALSPDASEGLIILTDAPSE